MFSGLAAFYSVPTVQITQTAQNYTITIVQPGCISGGVIGNTINVAKVDATHWVGHYGPYTVSLIKYPTYWAVLFDGGGYGTTFAKIGSLAPAEGSYPGECYGAPQAVTVGTYIPPCEEVGIKINISFPGFTGYMQTNINNGYSNGIQLGDGRNYYLSGPYGGPHVWAVKRNNTGSPGDDTIRGYVDLTTYLGQNLPVFGGYNGAGGLFIINSAQIINSEGCAPGPVLTSSNPCPPPSITLQVDSAAAVWTGDGYPAYINNNIAGHSFTLPLDIAASSFPYNVVYRAVGLVPTSILGSNTVQVTIYNNGSWDATVGGFASSGGNSSMTFAGPSYSSDNSGDWNITYRLDIGKNAFAPCIFTAGTDDPVYISVTYLSCVDNTPYPPFSIGPFATGAEADAYTLPAFVEFVGGPPMYEVWRHHSPSVITRRSAGNGGMGDYTPSDWTARGVASCTIPPPQTTYRVITVELCPYPGDFQTATVSQATFNAISIGDVVGYCFNGDGCGTVTAKNAASLTPGQFDFTSDTGLCTTVYTNCVACANQEGSTTADGNTTPYGGGGGSSWYAIGNYSGCYGEGNFSYNVGPFPDAITANGYAWPQFITPPASPTMMFSSAGMAVSVPPMSYTASASFSSWGVPDCDAGGGNTTMAPPPPSQPPPGGLLAVVHYEGGYAPQPSMVLTFTIEDVSAGGSYSVSATDMVNGGTYSGTIVIDNGNSTIYVHLNVASLYDVPDIPTEMVPSFMGPTQYLANGPYDNSTSASIYFG